MSLVLKIDILMAFCLYFWFYIVFLIYSLQNFQKVLKNWGEVLRKIYSKINLIWSEYNISFAGRQFSADLGP